MHRDIKNELHLYTRLKASKTAFFIYINAVVFTRETINYYENCILNTYYL